MNRVVNFNFTPEKMAVYEEIKRLGQKRERNKQNLPVLGGSISKVETQIRNLDERIEQLTALYAEPLYIQKSRPIYYTELVDEIPTEGGTIPTWKKMVAAIYSQFAKWNLLFCGCKSKEVKNQNQGHSSQRLKTYQWRVGSKEDELVINKVAQLVSHRTFLKSQHVRDRQLERMIKLIDQKLGQNIRKLETLLDSKQKSLASDPLFPRSREVFSVKRLSEQSREVHEYLPKGQPSEEEGAFLLEALKQAIYNRSYEPGIEGPILVAAMKDPHQREVLFAQACLDVLKAHPTLTQEQVAEALLTLQL